LFAICKKIRNQNIRSMFSWNCSTLLLSLYYFMDLRFGVIRILRFYSEYTCNSANEYWIKIVYSKLYALWRVRPPPFEYKSATENHFLLV
jgi:hypothetical protein